MKPNPRMLLNALNIKMSRLFMINSQPRCKLWQNVAMQLVGCSGWWLGGYLLVKATQKKHQSVIKKLLMCSRTYNWKYTPFRWEQ